MFSKRFMKNMFSIFCINSKETNEKLGLTSSSLLLSVVQVFKFLLAHWAPRVEYNEGMSKSIKE